MLGQAIKMVKKRFYNTVYTCILDMGVCLLFIQRTFLIIITYIEDNPSEAEVITVHTASLKVQAHLSKYYNLEVIDVSFAPATVIRLMITATGRMKVLFTI